MKDIDENGVDRIDRFRGYSQRFIQFSVADEVYRETLEYMQHLREQRDEARIRVCELCVRLGGVYRRVNREVVECKTVEEIAEVCGWDCFKGGGA